MLAAPGGTRLRWGNAVAHGQPRRWVAGAAASKRDPLRRCTMADADEPRPACASRRSTHKGAARARHGGPRQVVSRGAAMAAPSAPRCSITRQCPSLQCGQHARSMAATLRMKACVRFRDQHDHLGLALRCVGWQVDLQAVRPVNHRLEFDGMHWRGSVCCVSVQFEAHKKP